MVRWCNTLTHNAIACRAAWPDQASNHTESPPTEVPHAQQAPLDLLESIVQRSLCTMHMTCVSSPGTASRDEQQHQYQKARRKRFKRDRLVSRTFAVIFCCLFLTEEYARQRTYMSSVLYRKCHWLAACSTTNNMIAGKWLDSTSYLFQINHCLISYVGNEQRST